MNNHFQLLDGFTDGKMKIYLIFERPGKHREVDSGIKQRNSLESDQSIKQYLLYQRRNTE